MGSTKITSRSEALYHVVTMFDGSAAGKCHVGAGTEEETGREEYRRNSGGTMEMEEEEEGSVEVVGEMQEP